MIIPNSSKKQSVFKDLQAVYLVTPRMLFEAKAVQSPYRGSIEHFFYLTSLKKEQFHSFLANKTVNPHISSFSATIPQSPEIQKNLAPPKKPSSPKIDFLCNRFGEFSSDSEFDGSKESKVNTKLIQEFSLLENQRLVFAKPGFTIEHKEELPQIDLNQMLELELKIQENYMLRKSGEYCCKYCGDVFQTGCGLGGHIAKVHQLPKKKKIAKPKVGKRSAEANYYSPSMHQKSNSSKSFEPSSECLD